MKPIMLLFLVQSHPEFDVNITVHAFDIRESMVVNVVFDFPDIRTSAHHIQGKGTQIIHPFPGRITAMSTIVHDIEPNRGKVQSEQATKDNS